MTISKFGILYACFFILEILVSILLSGIVVLFNKDTAPDRLLFDIVNAPIGLNIIRLIYYSLPLVIVYLLLFKYANHLTIAYKPFVFSIFNTLVFAGLNLLYKLHRGLPTLEFTESLFWITIISIFSAPIILGQIPYFKRLMESI